MRSFDFSSYIGKLRDVSEEIEKSWKETTDYWKDGNSEAFEKEHLVPFLQELSNTMNVMQRMSDLTRQAQRECVPDRENSND